MNSHPWILVVDDDEDIREVMTLLLRGFGYLVENAIDGLAAWEKMKQLGPPTLMLLDLRMPRLSGHELVERMQRHPRLASTPVVIVSGDSEEMERCEGLPVREWLRKPVELDELLRVVARYLPEAPRPTAS